MIKGETEAASNQIKETLLRLKSDNKLNLYMYDIKDLCMHLFARKNHRLIGEILNIVRDDFIGDSSPIVKRILNDIEVDYYDAIKDENHLYESLTRQQKIIRQQNKGRTSVYRNSIKIIRLIEDFRREQNQNLSN